MKLKAVFQGVLVVLISFAMAGCGGGGSGIPTGTLNVSLTDTPACGYDHVYVTVDHIAISADGSSWTTVPVSSSITQPIDLLNLTNGVLLTLGAQPLAAGTYQQVRLVLKSNGSSAPWSNYFVSTGTATQTALTTPSAQQSGYKIVGPFTVAAGTTADLILDFNACSSIVVAGSSGQYLLKPVVKAIAQTVSGSIAGVAEPKSAVYAEQSGSIMAGTVADSSGNFTLSPLEQSSSGGTVDVVAVPPPPASIPGSGFGTAIVQDVPVTAGSTTSVGSIIPGASTINNVSGTVSVAGTPGAADLIADQTIASAGRTYQIAATSTTTGPYAFSLAISGPWLGTYGTPPISLTQDSVDAGLYAVKATDAAGTTQTQSAVDASTSPTNVDFSLSP